MALHAPQQAGVDWERLQALFQRATELEAALRPEFILRETKNHPQLRDELLALLACDAETEGGPLSRAVGSALVDVIQDQRRALLGRVVGSYKLVSILGQGGTGTVYLGERADRQYSGQVAVKIVDHTAIQGSLGERFRAERQILASLNHPNIARLVDAGETQEGQPYLVMEYVRGETVDRYCDNAQLNLRKRLELFEQICDALQYAHQNLIVHRDLKPANILVTPEGVPKLLDFGIAKLLDPGETAGMELTRVNDRLLTPEYASPEQILGGNITTASDIYSLGVVLYQLVCGLRPYRVTTSASQLELERSICVSDPDRPSTAVSRAASSSELPIASIAAARSSSVERLPRQLTGDIDSIVMRALRKEPQLRYSSVEQLAADIRRHLSNEPVQARQGNWLYYGQRFARRHTAGVMAAGGFLAFVVGVAIVMSIQRQQIAVALERATRDGQRAEIVSEFMLNVFSAADPYEHFGKEPTARNLLDQAARRIQSDLDQQPMVRARLLEAIGRSYNRMGQPDRAVTYLEDSLAIQQTLSGADHTRMGSILTELAIAQRGAAKYEESDRTFTAALKFVQQSSDVQSEAHAQLLADLGRLEMLRNDMEQAREYLTMALELMKRLRGPRYPEVGGILAELSNVFLWQNEFERAEQMARAAVDIYSHAPEAHPDRAMADNRLALILVYRDRLREAAPLLERALAAQRLLYGSRSNIVAETIGSLAQLRIAQEDYSAAEQLIREALAIHRESDSTVDDQLGYLQTMLATVLLKQRDYSGAEPLLRDALELFARSLPADHQYVASAEYYLGEALLGDGKLADAEAVLTASMNRWKRTDAPAWRSARSKSALGEVLYRQGRTREAEEHLADTFRDLSLDPGADRDAKQRARERIERFYTDRGQKDKLGQLLRDVNDRVAHSTP